MPGLLWAVCVFVLSPALAGSPLRTLEAGSGPGAAGLLPILIRPASSPGWELPSHPAEAPGCRGSGGRESFLEFLKRRAECTQSGIMSQLEACDPLKVTDLRSFWIVNCVTCRATPQVARQIAGREDVQYVRLRAPLACALPVPEARCARGASVAWGVEHIGAPEVWRMGYDGSGVIVSVIDTGVSYLHLDLCSHMWHDTDAGFHYGWDFCDNDADPMDENGHGTHVAGTVASNGAAGSSCGVAPGATIMALRVDVSVGPDAEQTIWDAFQFSLEHGARVISLSLGYTQLMNPQRSEWREAEENILAAGVVSAVSAGSEGGDPGSWGDIRTPGDCPPPWLHPDQTTSGGLSSVVTVGTTDANDYLASFSSLGYSTWMYDPPWYDYPDTPPDIGLTDPDVCAPGISTLSCDYENTSGYVIMSG
ncbi:S8 family serine peptidase, partial [Candidatus Fermentibacterales bacterium]|nr:S8 family serine peptidase [Candidatus Fermentibacterales bacterium]